MIDKIPVEFYNLEDDYAVTISPNDQYQCFSSKVNRLTNFRQKMRPFFNGYDNNKTKYRMYIEISQHGRLHLHGIIKFKSNRQILEHYLYFIPMVEKISSLKIDRITDINNWNNYIRKQQHIIHSPPITNYIDIPQLSEALVLRTDKTGAGSALPKDADVSAAEMVCSEPRSLPIKILN